MAQGHGEGEDYNSGLLGLPFALTFHLLEASLSEFGIPSPILGAQNGMKPLGPRSQEDLRSNPGPVTDLLG